MALQLAQDWTSRCTLMWPISILGQVVRLKFAKEAQRVRASSRLLSLLACALLGWARRSRGRVGHFGFAFHFRLLQTQNLQTHSWTQPRTTHMHLTLRSNSRATVFTPTAERPDTCIWPGRKNAQARLPCPLRLLSAGSIKACDAAIKQPTWDLCRTPAIHTGGLDWEGLGEPDA